MPEGPKRHTTAGIQAQQKANEERRRKEQEARPHHRLYRLRAYQRFRLAMLDERPLCEDCCEKDRVTPATDIHHVRKLSLHPEDLCDSRYVRCLCSCCHDRRTARGE